MWLTWIFVRFCSPNSRKILKTRRAISLFRHVWSQQNTNHPRVQKEPVLINHTFAWRVWLWVSIVLPGSSFAWRASFGLGIESMARRSLKDSILTWCRSSTPAFWEGRLAATAKFMLKSSSPSKGTGSVSEEVITTASPNSSKLKALIAPGTSICWSPSCGCWLKSGLVNISIPLCQRFTIKAHWKKVFFSNPPNLLVLTVSRDTSALSQRTITDDLEGHRVSTKSLSSVWD